MPFEREAIAILPETELDAGELISGMSVGVAHFDGEDLLRTTNDRFGALLPLLGPVVNRGIGFRDLMHKALRCGQFDLGSQSSAAWLDRVLTAFDRAQGKAVELKRSDRRWLMFTCRMTALGHRICNLVDISSQKRLSEFVAEFSTITGSRQIDPKQRIERMLLLGCAYLNLPSAGVLRETEDGLEVVAEASPSGECDQQLASLYPRIDREGRLTIEALDRDAGTDELDSLLIGKGFRLDEGDPGCIIFAGDHWGDGPLDDTDRQILNLLADWTGQELSRQSDQLELERAYQEVQLAATTDFLTGCYNRRHFLEATEASRQVHRRSGMSFAMLLLDVDHFKSVNDRFGHQAGDEALRVTADILRQELGDRDIVARYGGEEFAIFLDNNDRQASVDVAERIRKAIAATEIVAGDSRFGLTLSIGLCHVPGHVPGHVPAERGFDIEAAIQIADDALYAAKAAGRNRLVARSFQDERAVAGGPALACNSIDER